jgi:transcriptional adapter 2-alpha
MFSRFHSADEHEALVNGLLQARKLRSQIELYQSYRRVGIRSLDEAREYELDRRRREEDQKAEKHRRDANYLYETGRAPTSVKSVSQGRRGRGVEEEFEIPPKKTKKEAAAAAADEAITRIGMADAPNAEVLSEKELALCEAIPMLPMHYLAVKEAIVREMFRNGHLTKDGVTRVTKVLYKHIDMLFVEYMYVYTSNFTVYSLILILVMGRRSMTSLFMRLKTSASSH